MINISYDEKIGVIYIKLSDKDVDRTIEIEDNRILIDVDKEGHIVGLEILDLELVAEHLGSLLQKPDVDKELIKEKLKALKSLGKKLECVQT